MDTVAIARDDQGRYFFMRMTEGKRPRQYHRQVATVTCERGHVALLADRLVHAIHGKHPDYTADWLMAHAADPPEGLQIELLEWEGEQ